MRKSEIEQIQNKIGYQFKNIQLLEQAFTRESFAKLYGGQDNETLEFYGDRILDYAVVKVLCNMYGRFNSDGEFVSSKKVGQLCTEDCSLVKNAHLAERIDRLGLIKYLRVANGGEKFSVKIKADLFEAIIGAVAFDSDWDAQTISNVFYCMMYSKRFSPRTSFDPSDYIDLLEMELFHLRAIKTETFCETGSFGYKHSFEMMLDGVPYKIVGLGASDFAAKIRACEKGYKILRLVGEKRFIESMDYGEQLRFLHVAGVISEPCFRFEFFPRDSKRQQELWRCFGSLEDSENEFEFEAASRYEAQEEICRAILCDALGIKDDVANAVSTQNSFVCGNIANSDDFVRGRGLLRYVLSKFGAAA